MLLELWKMGLSEANVNCISVSAECTEGCMAVCREGCTSTRKE